jgi:hypothetical protein
MICVSDFCGEDAGVVKPSVIPQVDTDDVLDAPSAL